MSVVLGLSICTTQEFMCTDGSCVHRSVRCNLLDDCLDRSDEENCTLVVLSEGYQNYKPPPGAAFGIPLKISPEVNLVRFSQIDDINLAFSMEIEVALVWMDRNLYFNNLKSEEGKNQLSEKEVEAVWSPEIEFLNINDGRLQLLKTGVYARQVAEPEPPVFTDVKMDTIYQPKSSRLVKRQQYYASFNCQFELFSYPFDTQTCQIIIKLASADRKVIDLENATVTYSGMKYLLKYEVKNINILLQPSGGYAIMEVTFDLERRYSLLVLTVFLPTFLLMGISYGTLFIKPKDFDTRSMMALTTLLVMYTMFDQVSSNLPDTAYIKMVDLWFFFCIFTIFSVNIIHIWVEFLPPGDDDDLFSRRDRVSPITNGLKKESPMISTAGWTAEKVLSWSRKIVYPTIILVFAFIFWIVIFTAEAILV
ncbi:serotonin-gated chloride channel mod-1-like isoform X1 [Macrobrachium nipponense]|uniref:serotonin-gated chloride channel mod-1-like isoform X1 n=1 Tax=Macrobrachium nipponense TaxID=159736 RepID=UPI0030C8BB9B